MKKKPDITHLYHLYLRGPIAIADVALGYGICNVKVPREMLTVFPDACTCLDCQKRIEVKK